MQLVRQSSFVAAMLFAGCGAARAQQPIGSVSTVDATVVNAGGGIVEASAGRATMLGNSTVTAKDRTAVVALTRGGEVRVCRSTALQLSAVTGGSLLLALEHGAIEIHGQGTVNDVVVTPDLRFTLSQPGPVDLAMRVVANGDTCLDNRGADAPTLKLSDAFGETAYELKPGQHVMFEHGDLRQVVDRETTSCGCPPDEKPMTLADAVLSGGARTPPVKPEQAAEAHPFPAAVSEGLAEPAPLPAQAAGTTHVQVASTLAYDPNPPKVPIAPNAPKATEPVPQAAPEQPPVAATARKSSHGPFGAIGRFFKRVFVR